MTTETYPIVGAFYHKPAQAILLNIPSETEIFIRPEPTNQYDPFAIMVCIKTEQIKKHPVSIERLTTALPDFGFDIDDFLSNTEWQLGYLPRGKAHMSLLKIDEDLYGNLFFDMEGKPNIRLTIPKVQEH